jgi:murein L,D-transpeptidase YafK
MLQVVLLSILAAGTPTLPAARPARDSVAAVTPVSPRKGGGPVALADSIVVEKTAHRLTLYNLGRPIRVYLVALGAEPAKDKLSAGDRRTPEGLFSIAARNPYSSYHLSLRISYPDAAHRARAQALGVSPGGDIMIHGLPNGQGRAGALHRLADWTNGCIALTDEEIEEIWNIVPIGTPVQIKP